MPYIIRKLPNQDLYRVLNKETKKIHSYATTLENAKSQVRLLEQKEIEGGTIDKTSTGVMRIKLNDTAKLWLENKVLPLITNTTININDNRVNSGIGRTQVYGYGYRRALGFGEYSNNREHAELWRALALFGLKIVPNYIPWTAIQVNHNYKTKKHIDGNNIGLSLAVSFGDFTGGELVIGNQEYQTKLHPVIFNGALNEHFNRPITGNRYSLVYFVSAPKKYTDEQIYKLHNDLIDKVKKMEDTSSKKIGGSIEIDQFIEEGKVSIPEFNKSLSINMPTYMYQVLPMNKDGTKPSYKYRLVMPTNKTRNIATRKGVQALDIKVLPIEKLSVKKFSNKHTPLLKEFSPDDREKLIKYYDKVEEYEGKERKPIEKPNNKPRGFPAVLYKNARKQGLTFDEDTTTYGNNTDKSLEPKPKKEPKPEKEKKPKKKPVVVEEEGEDFFASLLKEMYPDEEDEPPKPNKSKYDIVRELNENAKKSEDRKKEWERYGFKRQLGDMDDLIELEDEKEEGLVKEIERLLKTYTKEEYNEKDLSGIEKYYIRLYNKNKDTLSVKQKNRIKGALKDFKTKIIGGSIIKNNISNNNNSMANKWITHVKTYASKNGMSYRDALRDPKCKSAYKTGGMVGCGVIDEKPEQELLAETYNSSQLGANAGKKFISL